MAAARSTALALLLLLVAVTGCSALTDTTPDADDPAATETPIPIDTPVSSPTPTPHDDPAGPSTGYISEPSNLGEHEEPHGIRLVNDRNETIPTATIRFTRDDGDGLVQETSALAPGDDHYEVLDYKANYTVIVTVGDQNATEHLSKSLFDCNDSTTTFTITEDNITVRTLTTTVECPTASSE